jgi:hypothetical protein
MAQLVEHYARQQSQEIQEHCHIGIPPEEKSQPLEVVSNPTPQYQQGNERDDKND